MMGARGRPDRRRGVRGLAGLLSLLALAAGAASVLAQGTAPDAVKVPGGTHGGTGATAAPQTTGQASRGASVPEGLQTVSV